jgi:hypothetical protein
MLRMSVEKELIRRMGGEKELIRRMGGEKWKIGVRLVKFTLSNVVWIENTLFPLF